MPRFVSCLVALMTVAFPGSSLASADCPDERIPTIDIHDITPIEAMQEAISEATAAQFTKFIEDGSEMSGEDWDHWTNKWKQELLASAGKHCGAENREELLTCLFEQAVHNQLHWETYYAGRIEEPFLSSAEEIGSPLWMGASLHDTGDPAYLRAILRFREVEREDSQAVAQRIRGVLNFMLKPRPVRGSRIEDGELVRPGMDGGVLLAERFPGMAEEDPVLAATALEWLRQRYRDAPYVIMLAFLDMHPDLETLDERLGDARRELGVRPVREFLDLESDLPAIQAELGRLAEEGEWWMRVFVALYVTEIWEFRTDYLVDGLLSDECSAVRDVMHRALLPKNVWEMDEQERAEHIRSFRSEQGVPPIRATSARIAH